MNIRTLTGFRSASTTCTTLSGLPICSHPDPGLPEQPGNLGLRCITPLGYSGGEFLHIRNPRVEYVRAHFRNPPSPVFDRPIRHFDLSRRTWITARAVPCANLCDD